VKVPSTIYSSKGINRPDVEILQMLDSMKTLTMTEISTRLAIPKSNVTAMVNRLIKLKCVKRAYSKEDRRIIYINLTETGKSILKKSRAMVEESLKVKMAETSQEDLIKIAEILEKMRTLIDESQIPE
jgi:MarR family transcriptional regulator, organic hydroperoxide resistance regulator